MQKKIKIINQLDFIALAYEGTIILPNIQRLNAPSYHHVACSS